MAACLHGVGMGLAWKASLLQVPQGTHVASTNALLLGEAGMLRAVKLGAQKSLFFHVDFLQGHIISSQFIKPCKIMPAFMGGLGGLHLGSTGEEEYYLTTSHRVA